MRNKDGQARTVRIRDTAPGRLFLILTAAIFALGSSGCYFLSSIENEEEKKLWQQSRDRGSTALEEKRLSDAETHFSTALNLARKLHSTDMRLIISLNELADIYYLQKRYTDAGRLYDEICSIFARLKEQFAPDVDQEYKIAEQIHATHGLANVRREEERFQEAGKLYKEAFSLCKKASFVSAASRGRLSRDYSMMTERMTEKKPTESTPTAVMIAGDKQADEDDPATLVRPGLPLLSMAINMPLTKAERIYGSYRKGPGATKVKGALALSDLGWIYYSHKKYKQSTTCLKQSLKELREVNDVPLEYLAESDLRLGLIYRELYALFRNPDDEREAEKAFLDGLSVFHRRTGPTVRHLLRNLAELYIDAHKAEKARKTLLEALRYESRRTPLAIIDPQYGLDPRHAAGDGWNHAGYQFECVRMLCDLNRQEALGWCNENLDRDEKVYGDKTSAVYLDLCYLAVAHNKAGEKSQEQEVLNQLSDFPLKKLTQSEIGMLSRAVEEYIKCGKYTHAVKLGRYLADLGGPKGVYGKKLKVDLYYSLAEACIQLGELDQANSWAESSLENHLRASRYDTIGSARVTRLIADIALKRGDKIRAVDMLKRTLEYMQTAYSDKTGNSESQLRYIERDIKELKARLAQMENST